MESQKLKDWIESYGDSSRFWDWLWETEPFDAVWREGDDHDAVFDAGFELANIVAASPGSDIFTYTYTAGDSFKLYFIGKEDEILEYLADIVKDEGIRRPKKAKK